MRLANEKRFAIAISWFAIAAFLNGYEEYHWIIVKAPIFGTNKLRTAHHFFSYEN
jgi:hypothetical protein